MECVTVAAALRNGTESKSNSKSNSNSNSNSLVTYLYF